MSTLFSQFIPPHSRSTRPSPPGCRHVHKSVLYHSFFVSLSSCNVALDTNATAGREGQKGKTQSFDFLARRLEREHQGARKCQQNHKEKGAQERNCTKLYRTPGLTSKLHMVLTFNNLPNTLGFNCSVDQCPDPDWLQGGAQESQTQSALQKAVKTKLTLELSPSKQVETCNLNLTC